MAFGNSLVAPGSKNPLRSKPFSDTDQSWRFVSQASSYAACLAVYSAALVDVISRTEELKVSEEDQVVIRNLLMEISAMLFSQASRMSLHATKQRRLAVLDALKLPHGFNAQAVNRIPRTGSFLFNNEFLTVIDSDVSMNMRAKDLAGSMSSRKRSFRGSQFERPPSSSPSFGRSFRGGRHGRGLRPRGSRERARGGFSSRIASQKDKK